MNKKYIKFFKRSTSYGEGCSLINEYCVQFREDGPLYCIMNVGGHKGLMQIGRLKAFYDEVTRLEMLIKTGWSEDKIHSLRRWKRKSDFRGDSGLGRD